jgi:hypothetical protein
MGSSRDLAGALQLVINAIKEGDRTCGDQAERGGRGRKKKKEEEEEEEEERSWESGLSSSSCERERRVPTVFN